MGMNLRLVSRRKGSTGRHLQHRLRMFGSWSSLEQHQHINCLEMMAVLLALRAYLPDLKGHHVLVCSDSMIMVAYLNHQAGLRSQPLYRLVRRLLI